MTPKQQRFVDEYLVDLNASAAAVRAGYAVKRADAMAWENLRKPEIASAIAVARQAAQERAQETVDDHLATLASLRDDARAAGQFSAAIKAEESRGKVLGYYVEKIHQTGDVPSITVQVIHE